MKVQDIPYERVTIEDYRAAIGELTQAARAADSADALHDVYGRMLETEEKARTELSVSEIRFTLNMKDEFYVGENEYYDTVGPEMGVLERGLIEAITQNAHFDAFAATLPDAIVKGWHNALKATDERVLAEQEEENRLTTRYSKLMSEMEFTFRGETMPLTMLKKFMNDADRATRKEAFDALGAGLGAHADELDDIYDSLVKVRDRMAKKLGYENYVELGYYRMNRICYNAEMVKKFRANVLADVVPAVTKLKRKLAAKLGIADWKFYDDGVNAPGGNPDPIVQGRGLLLAGQRMYREMSPITGEFFDSMMEADALDVESRFGKWGGGYCTEIPSYRQPFILANFNGTSADVDVVTHEAGHALAAYLKFKQGYRDENLGMEVAETHSMSMEFFAWKYTELFFGKDAAKYRFMHLVDSFAFLPYGTIVDYFQHEAYEHPDWTPAERNARYLELEREFRPYLSLDGIPYLDKGTRWQYQMHIFEQPFYYIDYCFAQTIALQFLIASLEDYDGALARYFDHVKRGGQYSFVDLVEAAGLESPFEEGALHGLAEKISSIADELLEQLG